MFKISVSSWTFCILMLSSLAAFGSQATLDESPLKGMYPSKKVQEALRLYNQLKNDIDSYKPRFSSERRKKDLDQMEHHSKDFKNAYTEALNERISLGDLKELRAIRDSFRLQLKFLDKAGANDPRSQDDAFMDGVAAIVSLGIYALISLAAPEEEATRMALTTAIKVANGPEVKAATVAYGAAVGFAVAGVTESAIISDPQNDQARLAGIAKSAAGNLRLRIYRLNQDILKLEARSQTAAPNPEPMAAR